MDTIHTDINTRNNVLSVHSDALLEEMNGQIDERKQIVAASERERHAGWVDCVWSGALFGGCCATIGNLVKSYNLSIIFYFIGTGILFIIYIYMLIQYIRTSEV